MRPPENARGIWASRSYPVREDMGFQRVSWRIERCGWIALFTIVVLALLGLFAKGPLSWETVSGASGLQVEYERFQRNGAATSMRLHVAAGPREEVVVRLNTPFLDAFTIESLSPQPIESRSTQGGVEMVFPTVGGGPLRVHLALRPESLWMVRSEVAVAGEQPARFTQFIFP